MNASKGPHTVADTWDERGPRRELVLGATTARELMTPNPVSISPTASVKEAALVLTEEGFSALPVVTADGRVVGVLSQADIVRYERERDDCVEEGSAEIPETAAKLRAYYGNGYHVTASDSPPISTLMTPIIVSVSPEAPCLSVIRIMLASAIHRVFVVDDDDMLIGVVSTLDVLQCLVS